MYTHMHTHTHIYLYVIHYLWSTCSHCSRFLLLCEGNFLAVNPIETQSLYGAAILSFLGGPHWGLAMAGVNGMPFCCIVIYLNL